MSSAAYVVLGPVLAALSLPRQATSLARWARPRLRAIAMAMALCGSCLLGVLLGQAALDRELHKVRNWENVHIAAVSASAVMASLADMDAREDGRWDIVFEQREVRAYLKGKATRRFMPLRDADGETIFELNMGDRVPLMRARLGHKECKDILRKLARGLHGERIEYRSVLNPDGAWRRVDDGGKGCQGDEKPWLTGMDFRIAPAPTP